MHRWILGVKKFFLVSGNSPNLTFNFPFSNFRCMAGLSVIQVVQPWGLKNWSSLQQFAILQKCLCSFWHCVGFAKSTCSLRFISTYSLRSMKSTILSFFRHISGGIKHSHALICLPQGFSFGMRFKSDHLISQVVEIQSLKLHSW